MFGDIMSHGISTFEREYEEIDLTKTPMEPSEHDTSRHKATELQLKMIRYLEDYNSVSKKPMHLVLFDFAIMHILRVCRVLRMARGNALLIGVGGSGRQSLAKLAMFICDFEPFDIEMT